MSQVVPATTNLKRSSALSSFGVGPGLSTIGERAPIGVDLSERVPESKQLVDAWQRHDEGAYSHARTEWGTMVGEAKLGQAAGGLGDVVLLEASSNSILFNYVNYARRLSARRTPHLDSHPAGDRPNAPLPRFNVPIHRSNVRFHSFTQVACPLGCSSRGRCDLQGFCLCDEGFWGLDCGITYRARSGTPASRTPVAWRHFGRRAEASRTELSLARPARSESRSPRIYVYDLDAVWRLGPQLLLELDHDLLERLLLSPFREADPSAADYFWIPGAPPSPSVGRARPTHLTRSRIRSPTQVRTSLRLQSSRTSVAPGRTGTGREGGAS